MLSVEQCESLLEVKKLDRKRVEEIRDYLYAISREVIRNNISDYKKSINKETYGKTQTTTTK